MRFRICIALLLFLSACATSAPSPREPAARNPRSANLQRAAELPWRDGGRCVVQEASQPWPILVERCFHALDTRRIRFRDTERRCPVASADAASLETMVGICLLAQPEIAVGAVVIIGVVMVAVAIKEELAAYEREASRERVRPAPQTRPTPQEPLANRGPKPEGSSLGRDWFPPEPPERERRPECKPQRVPHLGGNDPHNKCADKIPQNSFPGWDVLVNDKHFDALQLATRTLWEVKTNAIETYSPYVRRTELEKQVEEARREREIAAACGYQFAIGVRTEAHQKLLEALLPSFNIVLMTWC